MRDHQRAVGLLPYIMQFSVVQEFCRKLWALSYVPMKKVLETFTDFILPSMPTFKLPDDAEEEEEDKPHVDNYNACLEKYVNYFEATWLGAVNKRSGVRGLP